MYRKLQTLSAASALAIGLALAAPAFADETASDENTIVVTGQAKIGDYGIDLTARDLTADPGDDFERYASGAWMDRTEIPADRPSVGSFYNLREDVTEEVNGLVTDAPAGSQYGALYTSFMDDALEQARLAAARGEVPVGAVVYKGDEVLASAYNLRETEADPTAHAEVLALRDAAKKVGTWRLDGCRLAVTLEPCPMCAGAMVNARLGAAVFGITDPKMGCVQTLHRLLDTEQFNHRVDWVGGVLAEECVALLRDFFRARRGANRPPKPGPPSDTGATPRGD